MAKISAAQVKELRDKTGVGMMDAKKALVAVEGDMEKAIDFLREKVLENRADDEYYAPMISQLIHGKIITFERYLVSRSKDLKIR